MTQLAQDSTRQPSPKQSRVGLQEDHSPSPFSLLMPVYAGDRLSYVQRALTSNTVDQQLVPTQLVLVRDGPVGAQLQDFLDSLPAWLERQFQAQDRASSTPEITLVNLPTNSGLAIALNQGLKHCKYDIVARADSDDISLPTRFATMVPVLAGSNQEGYELVGSAIQEFESDEEANGHIRRGQIRMLPSSGPELRQFAKFLSPFHHPSVVYRKSSVESAGGYPHSLGRFEDYLLWEHMIQAGARICNLPEVLVLYRVDSGAYQRRGGWPMFRDELRMQKQFLADGFISPSQYLRNVVIRACYRLLPITVRKGAYRAATTLRSLLSKR